MNQKLRIFFLLNFCVATTILAQCPVADFTATPTNGTCISNGSIAVQIPDAVDCNNWAAILTPPSGAEQTLAIAANGGPVVFGSLSAGNYQVRLLNVSSGSTIEYPGNPVSVTTSYVLPSISTTSTSTSCNPDASNYTANATVTVTIAAGTGVGPFVYTMPGASNSPSAPTSARTYTFTGLEAGSYPFTVTDQPGVSGCEVSEGQTRVVAPNTNVVPEVSQVRYQKVNCPTNCVDFIGRFNVTGVIANITSATISINGGPPQPLGTYQLNPLHHRGFPSPVMQVGDDYVVSFTTACHDFSYTGTVPPAETGNSNITAQSEVTDCSVYNYAIRSVLYNNSTGTRKFCIANTTVEISGVGTFPMSPSGELSVPVPTPGTYNVTVSDGCTTENRSIVVQDLAPYVSRLGNPSQSMSLLENSGGISIPRVPTNANLFPPFSFTITPTDGSTTKTFTASHPFNLAGTYTANFPYVITDNYVASNLSDVDRRLYNLPLGAYNVVFADNCGNTRSWTIDVNTPTTYDPQLLVNSSCANSNSFTYNLNATHTFQRSRVRLLNSSGGAPGSLYSTLHSGSLSNPANAYQTSTVNNLPSGSYFLAFDDFVSNTATSILTNLRSNVNEPYFWPVHIPDYAPITYSVQSALCDFEDSNSGVISARLTGGTPVYPFTWRLFSASDPTVPIETFVADSPTDPNATSQAFNGLAPGDYFVRASSGSCISIDQSTALVAPDVLPQVAVSESEVCGPGTVILVSFPASEDFYTIAWTDNFGNDLGTGSSITVTVDETTTFTATVSPLEGLGCVDGTPFTSNGTVTVNSNVTQTGSTSTSCHASGISYTVSATFEGASPLTATGTGAPGNWQDNGDGTHTWTSDDIAAGTPFSVDIVDAHACNTLTLSGEDPVCPVPISGTVFNDANGNTLLESGESFASLPVPLYVHLVDSDGIIVAAAAVQPDGSYTLHAVPNQSYTLFLSSTQYPENTDTSTDPIDSTPPAGYETTGENGDNNTGPGDGAPDGVLAVSVGSIAIVHQNFGIQQLPIVDPKLYIVSSTAFGSTPPVEFPVVTGFQSIAMNSPLLTGYPTGGSLSGSDAEDCPGAGSCNTETGTTFVIVEINTNTRLYYDFGTAGNPDIQLIVPESNGLIANFDFNKLVIYGAIGSGVAGNELGFIYAMVDRAGAVSEAESYEIRTVTSLPVTLQSFAVTREGNTSVLDWVTTMEQRNKGFFVERSNDTGNWLSLGFVSSKTNTGNGNTALTYRFTDAAPVSGFNYYRLKQVDLDGRFEYSPIQVLQFEGTRAILVYPNPASNEVTVANLMAGDRVEVYDMMGRVVWSQKATEQSSVIEVHGYVSGLYTVRITTVEGNVSTHKLPVIR